MRPGPATGVEDEAYVSGYRGSPIGALIVLFGRLVMR